MRDYSSTKIELQLSNGLSAKNSKITFWVQSLQYTPTTTRWFTLRLVSWEQLRFAGSVNFLFMTLTSYTERAKAIWLPMHCPGDQNHQNTLTTIQNMTVMKNGKRCRIQLPPWDTALMIK